MEEKEMKKWLGFYRALTYIGLAFLFFGLIGFVLTDEVMCAIAMVGGLALANTGLIGHLGLAVETIQEVLDGLVRQ